MTPRVLVLLLTVTLSVCAGVNVNGATCCTDISDGEIAYKVDDAEPVIQKNDILNNTVSSLNTEATQFFKAPTTSITANSPAISLGFMSQSVDCLVRLDENRLFPIIGKLQAISLTKKQWRGEIIAGIPAKKSLLDPVPNIRYPDYQISVQCEREKPSVINL